MLERLVVGGIGRGLVGPGDTESFLRGYGETEVRRAGTPLAVARRAIPPSGAAGLASLFEPGKIVELASGA